METQKYPLLDKIEYSKDVKALPADAMEPLCAELRSFLVEHVTKTGGHLASNLGTVELTVALHRVFDLPRDRVIFDVGHQSYVHKLLSGRKDRFDTLRHGGLSGFTCRAESEYDPFGAGHASTSVSAALGFAEADRIAGRENYTVAVLGDGAFTGGLVHEALNNCRKDLRLILILNENEMSISRNTGKLAESLARTRSSKRYFRFKRRTEKVLTHIPLVGEPVLRFLTRGKNAFKRAVYRHSNYFEDLGLKYFGPIDGNDYAAVEYLLEEAKSAGQSVLLHLRTKKGKGYAPAEENPCAYHSVGADYSGNFSEHFGKALTSLAKKDESVCAITAAMCDGVGLTPFAKAFPDRFFDVGIAEGHALTFAAGLAAAGMKPYAAIYSTFLQRGYDNILHDIALQKLPVRIIVDRAALAAGDGPTHHGVFDVAFLSEIPNLCLFAPATFDSLDRFLEASLQAALPVVIRYPNGKEDERIKAAFFPAGTTETVVHANFADPEKNLALILTYGRIAAEALDAAASLSARGIPCGVLLLETLKPYETVADRIAEWLPEHPAALVFLEEGIRAGGAGMLTFDALCRRHASKMANKVHDIVAIGDTFVTRTQDESVYKTAKITASDVLRAFVHLLPQVQAGLRMENQPDQGEKNV